ncbi:hypothetical protein IQ266_12945 [filamentous cyanobacterium LEGE 11480]|uniref:Uncharacterized protein n=1 Tax=Romeriopsis navalis LEGE 11480 TaxID=2777977 RepID=A0A928VR88_9CYAN|nr:hypothetical protein [Romeriopsis navalis]MBE9030639.1 hypothetical protein [Romeriopsis navalis LEGE 11480]
MRRQIMQVQAVEHNVPATLIDSSGVITLGGFIIVFQLALIIILARRQSQQRSTKAHLIHLERSWQLKPSHNPHYN